MNQMLPTESMVQRCNLCKNPDSIVVAVRTVNRRPMAVCATCLESVDIVRHKKVLARNRKKHSEAAAREGRTVIHKKQNTIDGVWM